MLFLPNSHQPRLSWVESRKSKSTRPCPFPNWDTLKRVLFHPQKEDESKKSSSESRQPKQVNSSSSSSSFSSNMCGAYSAMLYVFRMLTPHERFVAARVCRMWRDLAYHNSLWSSVSLKVRLMKFVWAKLKRIDIGHVVKLSVLFW